MREILLLHALPKHKDFILYANRCINNVNDTEQTEGLA